MEKETWQNVTEGMIFLTDFDSQKNQIDIAVNPGRKVHVSPEGRRVVEERAADDSVNPFKNGTLNPGAGVTMTDGKDADDNEIKGNPNHLSDSDLNELFSGHWKTFEKRVSEIDAPVTIRRLIKLADSNKDGNVTKKQVDILMSRFAEIDDSVPTVDKASGRTDVEPAITFERPVTR